MRRRHLGWPIAGLLLVAACGEDDNSADTDRAAEELRRAQAALGEQTRSLAENQSAIEQGRRNLALEQEKLAREQRELADKQRLLAEQEARLGAAKQTLAQARAAYAAAVTERMAKLDASLATLGKRTDARARDALAGLRARRDQLSTKLAALGGTQDAGWAEYVDDVDTTFDAMERDLGEALK